jgi:hypothetical protein
MHSRTYLDERVLLQVFFSVLMRSREIWPTKENTSDVLVTVPNHLLHLTQCTCNEQTLSNENSKSNK